MIRYYKLFDLLNRKGMRKTDLELSSKTIAKLSKGANLNTDILDKICKQLDCQPGDIMEYIKEKTWSELWTEEAFEMLWNRFDVYHGTIEKQDFKEMAENCIDKKQVGVLKIDEEKLIKLVKEKVDISKVNL